MWKKILVVLIVFGIVLFFLFGNKKEKSSEIKEVVVKPVVFEKMLKTIGASGSVKIRNEEKIYVSRSMRIENVNFDEGDEVKKGDILITFDKEDRNNIIRQIKMKEIEIKNLNYTLTEYNFPVSNLEIKQKEANITEMNISTKKDINNKKIAINQKENLRTELINLNKEILVKEKLYNIEGISQSEYDNILLQKSQLEQELIKKDWEIEEYSIDIIETERKLELAKEELEEKKTKYLESIEKQKNNIEKTKNQIQTFKLEIESLEEDLEKTVENIKSSVDGTIIELNAEANFKVNLEQSLMTIADIDSQIITADISSTDIKYLKIGQSVIIKSDSLGENESIKGKVSKISSIAKTESGSGYEDIVIEIEISFDASKNNLKPGYSVDIEVIIDEKNDALTIPSFALQEGKRNLYVFIVNDKNIIEKKQVDIGLKTDKKIEVLNLIKGEKVVMNASKIKEGDKVKIVEKMTSKVSSNNQREGGQGEGGRP